MGRERKVFEKPPIIILRLDDPGFRLGLTAMSTWCSSKLPVTISM
ncbi:MAG TPA: hypothetical protein VEB69_14520 [Acidimicrobiia bacterium]|nr:hypothetical protein [Acidimicrobiia bacterium]